MGLLKIFILCLSIVIGLDAEAAISRGALQKPSTSIKWWVVSGLPAAPATNTIAGITDGASASDCTVGGGTNFNLCVYNGAAWVIVGDGASVGGGNSIFFEDSGASVGNNQSADIYLDALDLIYINGSGQNLNIGINWENLIVQSSGINWSDIIIQQEYVNWTSLEGVISASGINWQTIPNYAQGRMLYADTNNAIGVNWDTAPSGGTGTGTIDTSGTPVANDFAKFTDADTIEGRSYAETRADLDLEIGIDVQAYDADLTSWGAITPSSKQDTLLFTPAPSTADYLVGTASGSLSAEEVVSANGLSLVKAANYAAMRTLLDLEAGTDFYSISAADTAFEGKLDNSAGLAAAVSDETGTGVVVFSTAPTLVNPVLGNATGASLIVTGSISIDSDSSRLYLGADQDASIYYDGTDLRFDTSQLSVGGSASQISFTSTTSDPCGTAVIGTIFYNGTSNYMCFCGAAGADLKMDDNSTACF